MPQAQTDILGLIGPASGPLDRLDAFLVQHPGTSWCVVAIDIEHFKLYNEWYGWQQGNAVLQRFGECLVGARNTHGWEVGYLNNDDFYICMPDSPKAIQWLFEELRGIMNPDETGVRFSPIMGVCPVPGCLVVPARELYNNAQIAAAFRMSGQGHIHRFRTDSSNEIKQQQQLQAELEQALANREFCIYLQPQCNSRTKAIIGMEALARWKHPTRGLVGPSEFIPALEQSGLITQLDLFVWEAACRTLSTWKNNRQNLVPISVNVSVDDLQRLDVAQELSNLIACYDLDPKLIRVEFTETMIAKDRGTVGEAGRELHRRGFQLLMDDFGSGYSSLNMLKDTNVDVIKMDMKFIDLNPENFEKGSRIVESIINMAHQLNLPIIAEGIEEANQVDMLQSMDCLYMQGYHFYKPMDVGSAARLMEVQAAEPYWDLKSDRLHANVAELEAPAIDYSEPNAVDCLKMIADNMIEISKLNLITGEMNVVKRDERLPRSVLGSAEGLERYCDELVSEGIVRPIDVDRFRKVSSLENLRDVMFHTRRPSTTCYQLSLGGKLTWVTVGLMPDPDVSDSKPFAALFAREESLLGVPAAQLGYANDHDVLTGLLSRSRFEADLRDLPNFGLNDVVCTYIDMVGLHDVNNRLGHAAGDRLLKQFAVAARAAFANSRIYRIGGDEFVILSPDWKSDAIEKALHHARQLLMKNGFRFSAGSCRISDFNKLTEGIEEAERLMREEKQAYYRQKKLRR